MIFVLEQLNGNWFVSVLRLLQPLPVLNKFLSEIVKGLMAFMTSERSIDATLVTVSNTK